MKYLSEEALQKLKKKMNIITEEKRKNLSWKKRENKKHPYKTRRRSKNDGKEKNKTEKKEVRNYFF